MSSSYGRANSDVVHRLSRACQLLAAMTCGLALVVLIGWLTEFDWATRLLPGMAAMRPTTALCLLLLGMCWFTPRQVSAAGAGVVVVVTSITLIEYGVGLPTQTDYVAFTIHRSSLEGRMAVLTAASLLMLATCCLLDLSRPRSWPGSYRAVEGLSLAVMTISALALLGYAYGVQSLYSIGPFATIPLHTALALCLLGAARFASVTSGSAVWVFGGDDAGATLLRRLLPVTLFVVPIWGYLRLAGQRAGLYGTSFGLAIMAIGSTVMVTGTAWFVARVLARADRRRETAITALRMVNTDLEAQAQAHADELEAQHGTAVLMRDRERIAADLHDVVVQRLFSVALKLQMAAKRDSHPEFVSAIDGIDEAIRDLRGSIYALKQSDKAAASYDTLVTIAHDAAPSLSAEPDLLIQGDIGAVPLEIVGELVTVAREAVSNAIRHADASILSIKVTALSDEVTLQVRDDGRGLTPGQTSASGLFNIRTRAEKLGGHCHWLPSYPHGTVMLWCVPLRSSATSAQLEEKLHDNQTAHEQVMTAMLEIARDLLADDADPLPRIARAIMQMVDGDAFAIVVPHDDDNLLIQMTQGYPQEFDPVGKVVTTEASLTAQVIDSGQPLRIDDLWELKSSLRQLGSVAPYGPVLLVPLVGTSSTWGSVNITRSRGRAPFSQLDVDTATTIAAYGITALELREHPFPLAIHPLPGRVVDHKVMVSAGLSSLGRVHEQQRPPSTDLAE